MTTDNNAIEAIIRESLAETKSWGWQDDDRALSATGTAMKALEQSGMESDVAMSIAQTMVSQAMKEEGNPTLEKCPYCRAWHEKETSQYCPLNPKRDIPPDGWSDRLADRGY